MRTRSIRPNCKPLKSESPTSKRAWTHPVSPTFWATSIYVVVIILLAAAQAIAIVVIAYGFIATAVCVLVGPIFIPFFIVPKLEWLFWGWFKSFHPICLLPSHRGRCCVRHRESHSRILGLQPQGTISTVQLHRGFPVLFITFLAAIYALLKIPALTNHIFSGTSGGSSAAILERFSS